MMPAERPYHHGNLKEALREAALALIAEIGPRGFTLREVARRAGVSHNAPYRHFRDREALLAAVATEGFDRLTRALAAAGPKSAPRERLRKCGIAYVDFALSWPEHFAAMFHAPWDKEAYPECAAAAGRCFQTLLGFVRDAQAAGQLPPGDSARIANFSWSIVHGIATLANNGLLPGHTRAEVLRFCKYALNLQLNGRRAQ
jgi:AcrR family transcriptional regulator